VAELMVPVDDGWAGIAAALAVAQPGDTVRIAAGQYRGGDTLRVTSGVSLIGDEGNDLVYTGSETAILIDKARDVRVSGLSLRGYDGLADVGDEGETDSELTLGLIRIMASEAIAICDNQITAGAKRRNGISAVGSKSVAIERNRISGARRGIVFWSSDGAIVGNDCWGAGWNGINLQRDPKSPNAPSRALIRDNRCHDNSYGGIVLASSESDVIAGNECWSNGTSGIYLARDPLCPKNPSHARIRNNCCHDNKEGGIGLFSSESDEIVGNDCWGNGSLGISLRRDAVSPNEPSRALIRDNSCHYNQASGIGLFSSESEVIVGNDCCGNGNHGIALARDPLSSDTPSHAVIRDNLCYNNKDVALL
jgi:parallel beta-helix repeat protein